MLELPTRLTQRALLVALAICVCTAARAEEAKEPLSTSTESISKSAETPTLPSPQTTGSDNGEAVNAAGDADLAYGAFQRGYYLTAFELALPRAKLGDPAAQTLIAEIYDRGLGVAKDPKEAAAWFEIAAGNGDTEAKFGFAVKLLEGKYVEKDVERARKLMKEAADSGHATASFNHAQLLIEDRPTTAGIKRALPYLEYAAENRVADAYYLLGQVYASGRVKGYPEPEKAKEMLQKAAQAGIEEAQLELGIWLANGEGGDPDPKGAFRWIKRAALAGNVVARNRLAKMYAKGVGTDIDPVEAVKWHILARREGLSDAWLDIYINSIESESLSAGLAAANRWPG